MAPWHPGRRPKSFHRTGEAPAGLMKRPQSFCSWTNTSGRRCPRKTPSSVFLRFSQQQRHVNVFCPFADESGLLPWSAITSDESLTLLLFSEGAEARNPAARRWRSFVRLRGDVCVCFLKKASWLDQKLLSRQHREFERLANHLERYWY